MNLELLSKQDFLPIITDTKFLEDVTPWRPEISHHTNLLEFLKNIVGPPNENLIQQDTILRRLINNGGPPTSSKTTVELVEKAEIVKFLVGDEINALGTLTDGNREIIIIDVPWIDSGHEATRLGLIPKTRPAGKWNSDDLNIISSVHEESLRACLDPVISRDLSLVNEDQHFFVFSDCHLCTAYVSAEGEIIGENRGVSTFKNLLRIPELRPIIYCAFNFSDKESFKRRVEVRTRLDSSINSHQTKKIIEKSGAQFPDDMHVSYAKEYEKSGSVEAVQAVWSELIKVTIQIAPEGHPVRKLDKHEWTKKNVPKIFSGDNYRLLQEAVIGHLYPRIIQDGLPPNQAFQANTSDRRKHNNTVEKVKQTPLIGSGSFYKKLTTAQKNNLFYQLSG